MKDKAGKFILASFGVLSFSLCAAEQAAGAPEVLKADCAIEFQLLGHAESKVTLPPKLAKLFIAMVAQPSYKSHISQMPAVPLGTFTIGEKAFLWHGNGVILGEGDSERLWSGPLLQRMDNEKLYSTKPADMKAYFDILADDPNLDNTKVEGPGAYPGGGDALHPVERKDFGKVEPQKK